MTKVIKRNGEQKPFDNRKIRNAIRKANASVTVEEAMTDEQMDKITESVTAACEAMDRPASVEEIQDLVEKQLMQMGALDVAKNYVLYRKKMERARNTIRIRANGAEKGDVTDQSLLLVQGMTEGIVTEWDRSKIARRLVDSLALAQDKADNIAKEVETQLVASGLHTVSSALIRELVNNALIESGYTGQLQDLTMYKVPRDFVMGLMKDKTVENSNIVNNNPEAVSFDIASLVLKQFMFDAIMGDDVAKAHQTGAIHVHDANFPHRFYCSSHSVEYIKKYGLKGLSNLNTISKPARTASVLTGHLNTYLASMQAYYAGALGLGYINVLYAPFLVGMDDRQLKQVAQELIFNGSQNAFSRGGQSLHPTELIWVKEDGKYRQVEIGEFADSLIDSHPEQTVINADYEVYKTDACDFKAISFTRDEGKVEDRKIMYVARMPHRGKMYRIHTSNGIVNVTGDHSLFEFKGAGNVVPTKARNLKVNDYVVVPHKVSLTTVDTISITDFLDPGLLSVSGAADVLNAIRAAGDSASAVLADNGESRYIMKDAKKSDKVRATLAAKFVDLSEANLSLKGDSQAVLCNKLKLTKELGYLAGMYCAEGYNVHKTVAITNMDEELLGKVAASLDAMGYPHYSVNKPQRNEDGSQKACGSVVLNGILGLFLQKTCSEHGIKVLPGWIVDACDECVDGFLEGFHDGEGSNRRDPKQQNWSVSNTSRKLISGVSLLMLRKGRETLVFESVSRNPSWKPVYELRESSRRRVNPFTAQVTETSFNRYRKHINGQVRKDVEWLMASDLSLTRIKKIEEYEYDGPVYDISVPGTESFLGGIGNVFFKNTLFLDFNIHTGVPGYLKNVPAICPGGKYLYRCGGGIFECNEVTDGDDWLLQIEVEGAPRTVLREHEGKQEFISAGGFWLDGKVLTYNDFDKESKAFCSALLEVWHEGDANGHIFEFPKCDFHVSAETFTDPDQYALYQKACELASHNGSTYFVFDRDSVSLASCCFTGDTKVLTRGGVGSHVHLTTFKELADAQYSELRTNLSAYHNGGWSRAKLVTLPGKGKKIYRITTSNKKEQKVTEDHIVPTLAGDKAARDVTADDYILFSTRPCAETGSGKVSGSAASAYSQGVLIGAYLGDGSIEQHEGWRPAVHLSLNKEKYEELGGHIKAAMEAWDVDGEPTLHTPYNNVYPVYIPSWGLVEKIREWVHGSYCHSKELDLDCLREPEAFRRGIVDGLYATDGGNSNRIYTTSAKLAEQLEALFTSLGLQTVLDVTDRTGDGQVVIRGKSFNRNYPLYCIRWYESGSRRQYAGLYATRNNSVYYKVSSVEELPEEETVYCFEIQDSNEPYFTLPGGIITHNCRLKVQITDMSLLMHPERLRTCGFGNVTINIPQCAYRAAHKGTDLMKEIDDMMDLAVKSHLRKKEFLETLMVPGGPLWQVGKLACDGKPYIDPQSCVYIIGMIGVNDAVQYILGKEMHESDEAYDLALRIIAHMYMRTKEYAKQYGLVFKLEESPAESAARRLAKADLIYYRDDALKVFKGGSEDAAYYTNSIHLAAAAPVTIVDRIRKQSVFHSAIESGAIIHVFVGEERPDPVTIATMMKEVFLNTQAAQVTISPEFTYCQHCQGVQIGLHDTCDRCGSTEVIGETRVVGYFSRIQNWSKSKRYGELVDRHHGNYSIENAEVSDMNVESACDSAEEVDHA